MKTPSLFARITKVDEAKRLIFTRVVKEENDKAGEIFDYESSKPYFEAWSKEQFDASGGKSYGNVRAMHGKSAAGIFKEPLGFVDAEKAIDGVMHIVDDQDWRKVLAGVYTGASIGGSYVGERKAEKAADGSEVHRYTAKPVEVSLVDSPCVPSAKFFDVIKADGTIEKVAFAVKTTHTAEVIGTDEQVAEFAKALNDSKFTMADAIGFIAKAVADRDKKPDELADTIAEAVKVGGLRERLLKADATIADVRDECNKHLAAGEFDKMFAESAAAGDTLPAMREKIVAKVMEKVAMSTINKDRLQAAHDHLSAIGAACGGTKAASTDDLQKAVSVMAAQLTEATTKIAKLEAQPATHVLLRTVKKGEEKDDEKGDATQAAIVAKGFAWAVKHPDGAIDWAASAQKLANEQTGVAA